MKFLKSIFVVVCSFGAITLMPIPSEAVYGVGAVDDCANPATGEIPVVGQPNGDSCQYPNVGTLLFDISVFPGAPPLMVQACGASLVYLNTDPNVGEIKAVVTSAAHCIFDGDEFLAYVTFDPMATLEDTDIRFTPDNGDYLSERLYKVEVVVQHPNYIALETSSVWPEIIHHDVATIVLGADAALQLQALGIKPLKLPPPYFLDSMRPSILKNLSQTAIGYSRQSPLKFQDPDVMEHFAAISPMGPTPRNRKYGQLTFRSLRPRSLDYSSQAHRKGVDAALCNGDSGGPTVLPDGTILGIAASLQHARDAGAAGETTCQIFGSYTRADLPSNLDFIACVIATPIVDAWDVCKHQVYTD